MKTNYIVVAPSPIFEKEIEGFDTITQVATEIVTKFLNKGRSDFEILSRNLVASNISDKAANAKSTMKIEHFIFQ